MFPQSPTSCAMTRFQNILFLVQYQEFRSCKNNFLKKTKKLYKRRPMILASASVHAVEGKKYFTRQLL